MDQQLSTQYCEQVRAEQARQTSPPAIASERIVFDGDKLQNAKKRNAFFENEVRARAPAGGAAHHDRYSLVCGGAPIS